MREIGSEFWNVCPTGHKNNVFKESTQWFLSGRCALQAIVRELKDCHTVAMPSWCCDSMIKPFIDAGFEVRFYPVYWNEGIVQEISLDSDVLFLMDYFGYVGAKPELTSYRGIVIRDVTHSIFSFSYSDADYYFGSLRKWCGVWTGGYAWTKNGRKLPMENSDDHGYVHLREKAMVLKNEYVNGLGTDGKAYLQLFREAESALESVFIVPATDRDVSLANKLDVEKMKSRRRSNAALLRAAFPDLLMFSQMSASDCPLFVPLIVPEGRRDELKNALLKNEIYCPIHWPVSEYHKLNRQVLFLYENSLSLVCDQRYTEKDMDRLIRVIRQFWKEVR